MGKTSPTQRSLKYLREQGYLVAIVEHWNPFAKLRVDLFGCIDLICIGNGETVGVQTTSYSNVPARIKKIEENEALPLLRDANWRILVHGWKKGKDGKWTVREVDLS